MYWNDYGSDTYKLNTAGNCGGNLDFVYIKQQCDAAAVKLELEDTSADEDTFSATNTDHATYPFGCYYKPESSGLFFNRNNVGTARVSLCICVTVGGVAHTSYTPVCLKPSTEYSTGEPSSNECSCGMEIDEADWCASAAASLGETYDGTRNWETAPKGCIKYGGTSSEHDGTFL